MLNWLVTPSNRERHLIVERIDDGAAELVSNLVALVHDLRTRGEIHVPICQIKHKLDFNRHKNRTAVDLLRRLCGPWGTVHYTFDGSNYMDHPARVFLTVSNRFCMFVVSISDTVSFEIR